MNGCAMFDDAPGEEQQLLLSEVDILRELPEREVDHVATRSPIVRLGEKETLTLGEALNGILFLVSGRARVHEPAFRGQDLTFSVAEGGTVVGQSASALRPSRTLRVEALEPSILRTLGWEEQDTLSLHPPAAGEHGRGE